MSGWFLFFPSANFRKYNIEMDNKTHLLSAALFSGVIGAVGYANLQGRVVSRGVAWGLIIIAVLVLVMHVNMLCFADGEGMAANVDRSTNEQGYIWAQYSGRLPSGMPAASPWAYTSDTGPSV
jgi:hypothetical protein